MEQKFSGYEIDYIELYTPMAKLLAYWHQQALGFTIEGSYQAAADENKTSYVLKSGKLRLVLTSAFPTNIESGKNKDISAFISKNQCGVKRIAFSSPDVNASYETAIKNGGISIHAPVINQNAEGRVIEAAIKLYDDNEILFINREQYAGYFKPGYVKMASLSAPPQHLFSAFDHVAAELRIGQSEYWTNYLANTIGTNLVQSIEKGKDNETGMVLKINQFQNKQATFVMAEPDGSGINAKIENNINKFGQGIHHLAFQTDDILSTIEQISKNNVEFVNFPPAYYTLLREDPDLKNIDIDLLEKHGILIDKEEDTFLYQKFIKPYGDRPFFFYEIVQRVNGYDGFALKNINVLKKAEEYQIMSKN